MVGARVKRFAPAPSGPWAWRSGGLALAFPGAGGARVSRSAWATRAGCGPYDPAARAGSWSASRSSAGCPGTEPAAKVVPRLCGVVPPGVSSFAGAAAVLAGSERGVRAWRHGGVEPEFRPALRGGCGSSSIIRLSRPVVACARPASDRCGSSPCGSTLSQEQCHGGPGRHVPGMVGFQPRSSGPGWTPTVLCTCSMNTVLNTVLNTPQVGHVPEPVSLQFQARRVMM